MKKRRSIIYCTTGTSAGEDENSSQDQDHDDDDDDEPHGDVFILKVLFVYFKSLENGREAHRLQVSEAS